MIKLCEKDMERVERISKGIMSLADALETVKPVLEALEEHACLFEALEEVRTRNTWINKNLPEERPEYTRKKKAVLEEFEIINAGEEKIAEIVAERYIQHGGIAACFSEAIQKILPYIQTLETVETCVVGGDIIDKLLSIEDGTEEERIQEDDF